MPVETASAASSRTALDRFADFIVQFVPDPITASIILLLPLGIFALALGNTPVDLAGAYYKGIWSLLPFTSQMAFTILLGTALGGSPLFHRWIGRLARIPRSRVQLVAFAVLLTAIASYLFWSLGYALSPIIAVVFAREAERKGFALHFPFFLGTVYATIAVWQFGLSSSAPLLVATPGHFLEHVIGVIPLSRTIWSPAAILDTLLFAAAAMAVGSLLMPKSNRQLSDYPGALQLAQPVCLPEVKAVTLSEKIESKSYFGLLLAGVLASWLWYHFGHMSAGMNINSMIYKIPEED